MSCMSGLALIDAHQLRLIVVGRRRLILKTGQQVTECIRFEDVWRAVVQAHIEPDASTVSKRTGGARGGLFQCVSLRVAQPLRQRATIAEMQVGHRGAADACDALTSVPAGRY